MKFKEIKKRFKRALAAFLREEILEYIGYNHNIPSMSLKDRFYIDEIPFETVVMETLIPIDNGSVFNTNESDRNFEQHLENHIRECKVKFANDLLKYIRVDAQKLTSMEGFLQRSVKFSIRIQPLK